MSTDQTIRIELLTGDITEVEVDAIVNAANSSLLGGGGVDGAIHRAGGPAILEACRAVVAAEGGCRTGEAVATVAGDLPADYVIHTVGPVWGSIGEDEADRLLGNCYRNSLASADQLGAASIAFPNISTGVYGFPKERAADVAVRAVTDWLVRPSSIERVVFVCFDEANAALYRQLLHPGN